MSDELLISTLTVKGAKGDSYVFAIPGLYAEYRIAARVKDIRTKIDPNWDGFASGLDFNALWSMKAAATFDVQLRSSSARWPWSKDDKGLPVVDSERFPDTMVDEVHHVYREFLAAVTRFRETGSPDPQLEGEEAVAS